jgi:transposase
MRRHPPHLLRLTKEDKRELERLVREGHPEQRVARRARVLLAMEPEQTVVQEVAGRVAMSCSGIWHVCRRYEERGGEAVFDAPRRGRPREIPPLVRVQLEQLACCEPAGGGLVMTHWSTRGLAQVAVQRGIIPRIARSAGAVIWQAADLPPHRYRYWKTPLLDSAVVARASKMLWGDEHLERRDERGEVMIRFDEQPNLQALERRVHRQPMQVGQIERQEFEYKRHGTVNFAAALIVNDGRMRGWCLAKNESTHLGAALAELFEEVKEASKIHLLWDGGPSHTSTETRHFLQPSAGWGRGVVTPAQASRLNQGELLLRAFSGRYLKRGDWKSRRPLIPHLEAAWQEDNSLFAPPFTWSWTRRDMRRWVARQTE